MKSTMHRTQISLEDWQYQFLTEMSRKTKKSLSAIIRDLVSEKLSSQVINKDADPIRSLMGMGSGDGSFAARDHDKYLYGKTK